MSDAYKIHKQDAAYYLTFQVVEWVDIFSRKRYRDIILESLNFCVEKKGLCIYAYVIMTNHIHLLASAANADLSAVVRDFKRHTSRMILRSIQTEPESRRQWMLDLFKAAAGKHSRNEIYQLWTHENH